MILDGNAAAGELIADVAVVGAGPAGIVTSLELADAGFDVLLIESGGFDDDSSAQALGEEASRDPERHARMSLTTRRGVGGASAIWGGRCVPYDPIDFDRRPWITDAEWPVDYDDLAALFPRACTWFACGRPVFDARETGVLPDAIVPGLPNGDVLTSSLERWSLPTHFGRLYAQRLREHRRLRLVTGATCILVARAETAEGVDHLSCRTLAGRIVEVRARRYVLACGGLETTRLLLASAGPDGVATGNHSDHLGRWYMAHVEGVVAEACFDTPPRETIFAYERDTDGVYVRRRLSFARSFQHQEHLTNVIAWLLHPELADAAHGSGPLSLAYLALVSPLGRFLAPDALRLAMTGAERVPGAAYGDGPRGSARAHLANLVRDAPETARFAASFGARRFLARGRRAPGFAVYRPANRYPLHFHGEHIPRRESRVTLSDDRDALGLQRLSIDIRFGDDDVEGIVRAHRLWDEYLRRHSVGRLEYLSDDVHGAVAAWLGGGFHQSGTTRISRSSEDGVVDSDLAVHGVPVLHVISSSVFPTSSQANSTFMIVPFALRLVDFLKRSL
jgi:choline dehydrogenase-like flavoprotein